ncbi:MAG: endonuclease domain-containing protein [Thermaceae bacterium]|nr:endonuclease domain-containing protein [Thermaceae bacterium]
MNWRYSRSLIGRAKDMRQEMTRPAKLWFEYLKGQTPRWRNQRPFGPYILDFYCAAAKLAVEVDGESHFTEQGLAYDAERTTYLEALGIRVLRFTNLEVSRNFGGVCETIERQTAERLEPQPCFKP